MERRHEYSLTVPGSKSELPPSSTSNMDESMIAVDWDGCGRAREQNQNREDVQYMRKKPGKEDRLVFLSRSGV